MTGMFFMIAGAGGLGAMLGETQEHESENVYVQVIGLCTVVLVLMSMMLATMLMTVVLWTAVDKAKRMAKLRKLKQIKSTHETFMRVPKSKSKFRRSDNMLDTSVDDDLEEVEEDVDLGGDGKAQKFSFKVFVSDRFV